MTKGAGSRTPGRGPVAQQPRGAVGEAGESHLNPPNNSYHPRTLAKMVSLLVDHCLTSTYYTTTLVFQGKHAAAESLYQRSQAIRVKALGPEHPLVAQLLNNQAVLCASQVGAVKIFQGHC